MLAIFSESNVDDLTSSVLSPTAARAPCGFLSRIVAFHKTWLSILVLFLLYSTSTNAFYGLSGPRRSQFVSVLYASTPSKLPVVGSSFYAEVRKQGNDAHDWM